MILLKDINMKLVYLEFIYTIIILKSTLLVQNNLNKGKNYKINRLKAKTK